MAKPVVVDESKCTGCRICEIVCSFAHNKNFNPRRSRISILKDEENGTSIPKVCRQCENPLCIEACPNEAIYRNEKTGMVTVDADKCTGCGTCTTACPFQSIFLDVLTAKAMKCDLCDGNPKCVEFCPRGVLSHV